MAREEATMTKQTKEVQETTKHHLHHRLRSHNVILLLVRSSEQRADTFREQVRLKLA